MLLSRNTQRYLSSHNEILHFFLKKWPPELETMAEFGEKSFDFDGSYPNQQDFTAMPRSKRIKLKAIHFKHWNNIRNLSGIQLEFTSGVKSDMLETEQVKNNERHLTSTIDIDYTRTIAKVSMKVVSGSYIAGLRLIDKDEEYIVNETWNQQFGGVWVTAKIREGMEIIGVKCCLVGTNIGCINRLAF